MISDIYINISTRRERRQKRQARKGEVAAKKALGKLRQIAGIPGALKPGESSHSVQSQLSLATETLREVVFPAEISALANLKSGRVLPSHRIDDFGNGRQNNIESIDHCAHWKLPSPLQPDHLHYSGFPPTAELQGHPLWSFI